MEGQAPLIALFASAIAGLSGFIVWLIKLVINRLDKRVADLEEQQRQVLSPLVEVVRTSTAAINTLTEAFKEFRLRNMRAGEREP